MEQLPTVRYLGSLPAFRKPVPDGVKEEFVAIDGHRMRFLTAGSGPPLVLIHGLMGYSFSFTENILELAKSSTVYAPDMFNLGGSDRLEVPCTLDAATRQILQFMETIGVDSADILGSSHGGSVAMKMAIKEPSRIRSLTLVSPAHPFTKRLNFVTGTLSIWGLGDSVAWLIRHTPRPLWGLMLFRIYARASRALPGTVEGYGRPIVQDGTTQHALRVVRCWQRDFDQLEGELDLFPPVPTLLIWGARDKIVPLRTAAKLQEKMPNAEMVTIPDCGHVPYEELPDQFNAAVNDFLRRVRAG